MEFELNQKPMRRMSKEISKKTEIEEIIGKSLVCRIAVSKDNIPYIVPVSFGYDGLNLFIHTAPEGRKIDFWTANSLVCFEFDVDVKTIGNEEKACKWNTTFRSVIGYGRISEINAGDEKIVALNHIMKHYSGRIWEMEEKDLKGVKVWKLSIIELTGKKSIMD